MDAPVAPSAPSNNRSTRPSRLSRRSCRLKDYELSDDRRQSKKPKTMQACPITPAEPAAEEPAAAEPAAEEPAAEKLLPLPTPMEELVDTDVARALSATPFEKQLVALCTSDPVLTASAQTTTDSTPTRCATGGSMDLAALDADAFADRVFVKTFSELLDMDVSRANSAGSEPIRPLTARDFGS